MGALPQAVAVAPLADASGTPRPYAPQTVLANYIQDGGLSRVIGMSMPPELLVGDLRAGSACMKKHAARLCCMSMLKEVPWMPRPVWQTAHPAAGESPLATLVEQHGIYLTLVYRFTVLRRLIDGAGGAVPIMERRAAALWESAHVPITLYIMSSRSGEPFTDADLLAYSDTLGDKPVDLYAPGWRGCLTPANSMPDLGAALVSVPAVMLPGCNHPHYVPPMEKPGDETALGCWWRATKKQQPGRCLSRGTEAQMVADWRHLYHMVRWSVAMLLLNGYGDSPATCTLETKLCVTMACIIRGNGPEMPGTPARSTPCPLRCTTCGNGMCRFLVWFEGGGAEVVYTAMRRFMLWTVEGLSCMAHGMEAYYRAAGVSLAAFRSHVVNSSRALFESVNADGKFERLCGVLSPGGFTGPKIPKNVSSGPRGLRPRDVDVLMTAAVVTLPISPAAVAALGLGLRVVGCEATELLDALAPPGSNADRWASAVRCVVSSLDIPHVPTALTTLRALLDHSEGQYALFYLRVLLLHRSTAAIRLTALPYADTIRQGEAVHRRCGESDEPRLWRGPDNIDWGDEAVRRVRSGKEKFVTFR